MKNEETKLHPVCANWHFFIHPSSFFISLIVAGECELRGQEQPAVELPGIGAGGFGQAQSAGDG